jgi:hypothetical protein
MGALLLISVPHINKQLITPFSLMQILKEDFLTTLIGMLDRVDVDSSSKARIVKAIKSMQFDSMSQRFRLYSVCMARAWQRLYLVESRPLFFCPQLH